MGDNEMLDIYNGEIRDEKPPIKKVVSNNVKPNKYAEALRNPSASSGYSSPDYYTNLEGGLKIGSENPFDTSQKEEADAQSFGKQLSMTVGNTLFNVFTGTVGGLGYLGTLFEDTKGDYSNAITDWADRTRNPFGELKRKNNETIDITDSAFWLNSGQSLVESAIQFGIIAETGGLAAGAVVGKLGKLIKLSNTATKLIKGGIQGATAMELSYLEGAMSGATVYRDIYKNQYDKLIAKGTPVDKADEIAKKYASEGASSTVKLNTTIGTALNLTGIGSVFKTESNEALKYFTKGAGKKLANESIQKYTQRLVKDSPQMLESFTKKNYGRLLSEMTQEGVEEVATQLAENTGRKQGEESKSSSYLGMFQDAYDNLNSVVNDEGVLNFALGAVGGVAQTVLLDNVIPSQKVNDYNDNGKLQPILDDKGEVVSKNGKVQYKQKLVSPKQRDVLDNQRYYTQLKDALVTDLTNIEKIQQRIENSNDEVEKEELRRKLFAVNTLDSVYKGTGENLIESYTKILETDNQTDLSLPFIKRKEEIEKTIDEITSSVDNTDELSDEVKAQLVELKKELIFNSEEAVKNENQTPATLLGLSKNKTDNDYRLRATKAITEIQQISYFHNQNKEKYNLPEEINSNYPDYVTKLQADVLGRTRIHNDLSNDFLKQKADFQLFSSIEDYSEIEKLLFDGELSSLLDENNNITEKLKNYKSINELQDIVDTLSKKVYNEEEMLSAIDEKVKNNRQKIDDIQKRIEESEDYKKANKSNINDYLESRINKYADFTFLMDFKKQLDTFQRDNENIKQKIKDVTSNKGRNRFINDTNDRIKKLKEQLENEYAIYSYEEARKMNEDDYYFSKVNNIDTEEKIKLQEEIKRIQEEVDLLEKQSKNTTVSSSYFNSFVDYFKGLNDMEYLIKLRKNRIIELQEYLDLLEDIKQEAKEEIKETETTSEKDNVVKNTKKRVKEAVVVINEKDETLEKEAGKVVEVPELPNENETKETAELKAFIKKEFGTMSDFIQNQLQSLSVNYTLLDMLNTTINNYNIIKESRLNLVKQKIINLFGKLLELNNISLTEIEKEKENLRKEFSTINIKEKTNKPVHDELTPKNPKLEIEDENLDIEAGTPNVQSESGIPDMENLRETRKEAYEIKNNKENKDKKAEIKKEENNIKSKIITDKLNAYIEGRFPIKEEHFLVKRYLLSMYESGSYNFLPLFNHLLIVKKINVSEKRKISDLKIAIQGLQTLLIELHNFDKEIKKHIVAQIKLVKEAITQQAPIEQQQSNQQQEEEEEEIVDSITQLYDVKSEEKNEEEDILPFTLDMLRIQYGGINKLDNIKAYNIKAGSKVSIRIEKDNLTKFKYGEYDYPISIFLEGERIGYIPTLDFIDKKYVKDGQPLEKEYFANNFQNFPDIKNELDDIVTQIRELNLPTDIVKEENIDLGFGLEKVFIVNFHKFNFEKIAQFRNQFLNDDLSINTDKVLTTKIKKKSNGRAIVSDERNDLSKFVKHDAKRIKIHTITKKGIYPFIKDLAPRSFNYKKSKILSVISYPNANGSRNIYPVTIDTLNKDDVKSLKYLFNLFNLANTGNQDSLVELTNVFESLGFSTEGKNPLYVFNDFISTYYTNISKHSTTTTKNNIPILYYYKNDKNKKDTNDFVIKINKMIKGKQVEESYHLNNTKQTQKFLETLDLFSNKLFTLDNNRLDNARDIGFYPVFEDGKIKAKSMSYFEYIQSKVKTKLDIDEKRLDNEGKIIYVQDYVLTLDSKVEEEITTNIETVKIEESVSTPPKINNNRRKLGTVNENPIELFNLPTNTNTTDRIGNINNPLFVEQFINSNEDYKIFIANFIQVNILNDTFSDNQKLEIYKKALEAKNLDDANKIFHKICP